MTLVAGKISVSASATDLIAYSNDVLFYATSTATDAMTDSGGVGDWTGTIYVPNGSAAISGSSGSVFNGLIAARQIAIGGGNFSMTGTGPILPADLVKLIE